MRKIKIGLFGLRGHQIHALFGQGDLPEAQLVAVAGFGEKKVRPEVRVYQTLDELLADQDVELVSLCSPFRSEQAGHAVRAMRAGKHVYSEKPVAMTEPDLDAIIRTARETGMCFHEMGGLQFSQPYLKVHEIVRSGVLGEVVQIHGQKSYPWTERRPTDENVDGGLAMQVGIYLTRFVEHIAAVRIKSIEMVETRFGNPVPGHNCRMAVAMQMTLANGGIASGTANYLNPMGDKVWGYEILRIFGTRGLVESSAEEGTVRLILQNKAPEVFDARAGSGDYFGLYVKSLLGQGTMPLAIEDELSPTRWVVRAKAKLNRTP
jgi:predicted dehydrogenase